ncbi:serine/arginine repetitive matrix protein 2-like isoform X2 [Venturia canescens]|uniref:serine/arginine repetitive matrix protein 2-like isoform X2 n=1 Tax=Venturia canescens TaxID=32260 RepID=UPI001C9D1E6E|nr:serine/arginine repetitive matrix protein 2-like isoform X2 [Venturia canescens]
MSGAPQASSRLEMLQARFQQRQLAEKEQKLLQLYDQQQLRAHQVAQRGSAGSNGSNGSGHGNTSHHQTVTRTSTTTHATSNSQGGGGKVRQMFDERRQTTVKGIDKSYPLEPLENRSRKHQTTTTTSNVTVNSTSQLKNGNPTSNRRSVVTRRTVRSEANSNVNDGKPVVTYHEEVSREISDLNDRDNEQEEFGDDNFHVSRYENGNRRVDRPNQLEIEDVTNENTSQRHRTTAKIHLAEFERSNVTNLENEPFPNDEIINMPEKLPGRSSTGRKSFQSETKLERPKISNVKKTGQPIKQVAGNTTSFTKKRNDNSALSGSSTRASAVTIRMEGEVSRGRSTSPELEGSRKSRTSSPEVSENKGKLTNPAASPVTKMSGVTRVSQLSQNNSTDFYPRRKSEFEKSKTFRKLQLELGESSPEPNEPEDLPPSVFSTQCRKRSSIFNENTHSSERRSSASSAVYDKFYSKEGKASPESQSSNYRRESRAENDDRNTESSSFDSDTYSSKRRSFSSSSPTIDHGFSNGRKESLEKSSKRAESQTRFSSPTFRRKSTSKNEESKTLDEGTKTSTFDSSTYSSKQHSTTWNPTGNRDFSKERKTSQEKSGSPGQPQSSNYPRKSAETKERRKTSKEEIHKTSFDSTTDYLRRRSSSSSPFGENDSSQKRRKSYEKSPERPESRAGSTTSSYRRDSLTSRDERRTKSNYESSTFASRIRSGSPMLIVDYDLSEERSAIYETSQNRPASRGRSQSPTPRGESMMERDEKFYENDSKNFASSTYSSRQHSASPVPPVEHGYSEDEEPSRKISYEAPRSRGGSESPTGRRESVVERDERSAERRTTNFASSTYASRQHVAHPTSPGDDRHPEDRRTSHSISHEAPGSRERSQSPNRRGSLIEHDERSTGNDTSFASSTFSSRQHAAYPASTADDPYPEDRQTSHTLSHRGPGSRERSQSPVYPRESFIERDERSTGKDFASPTFSSRQHAAWPMASDEYSQTRVTSHTMSHEARDTRERSQSPAYRRESITEHDERSIKRETAKFASANFSTRQHSDYTTSYGDGNRSEDRKTSYTISQEAPRSRERSQSPTFRRGSYVKDLDAAGVASGEAETSSYEASTFSSRCHSTFQAPTADYDFPSQGRAGREKSPEDRSPRRESQSPIHRRESIVKSDDKKASTFASSAYSSRRRSSSSSPILDSDIPKERARGHDRDDLILQNRPKSGENLRSFELIKKIVRPPSPDKKTNATSTKKASTDRRTTLEDIELSTESSKLRETTKRPKSPVHKVVKKDKPPTAMTKREKTTKTSETNTRGSGSRTISPSPDTAIAGPAAFEVTKNECRPTGNKKIETKVQRNSKDTNSTKEKAMKKANSDVSRPDDGKDSRRSSSEITVKRHDTFKVAKPNENTVNVCPEAIGKDKEENLAKKSREEFKDKSQLLERIEKIRSTLSRSGRSEQNLRSNGFERTDSVESALKRFDSIGVETEHHVTVGVDEPDRVPPKAKSETFYSTDVKKIPVTEEIIVKKTIAPLCRPAKTTVAVVKAQPRQTDAKSLTPGREREVAKSGKSKREKSMTTVTTPRNTDKKMVSKSHEAQKRATSMVKKSRLRSEEPSGRGEGRRMDSSPLCKRKLFEDSESEMESENVSSTIVLTATTRVTNNSPIIMEIETKNNRESVRNSAKGSLKMESSFGESKMENEPAKILRSIEDIRKSIKRESQDFKRELNKFNKAMRRNSSTRDSPDSILTSGTVSCVQITKTFKSGDRQPVVKIEKSIVKLPIAHRVAKSQSPDIGTKRSVDTRTKTTTNNLVRRSVPSSPARIADTSNRCGSSELRVSEAKSSMRTLSSPGSRETKNLREYSITTEYTDVTDGTRNGCETTETEIMQTATTRKNSDAFVSDFNDPECLENKKSASSREEFSVGKRPSERSLTSQRQYGSATISTSSRPASALSTTSSATSTRGQSPQINSKSKMSTKAKSPSSDGARGPNSNPRTAPPATDANDGLVSCKICSRRFNSDRVARHEQICSKTTTKKRKQFDATSHRVKGTELEQFVKKGASRKSQADRKAQKPEVKSNWRRKHDDFINAIRSAKQVSAHLAAGGKLSDLPPPPPSDTSDYVQCPHCGRKFNQGAADRHIPKCQTMMHNKPNSRAPPKPKR